MIISTFEQYMKSHDKYVGVGMGARLSLKLNNTCDKKKPH